MFSTLTLCLSTNSVNLHVASEAPPLRCAQVFTLASSWLSGWDLGRRIRLPSLCSVTWCFGCLEVGSEMKRLGQELSFERKMVLDALGLRFRESWVETLSLAVCCERTVALRVLQPLLPQKGVPARPTGWEGRRGRSTTVRLLAFFFLLCCNSCFCH